ncbi:uncharacterized protein LOC124427236 [Vespa crabro]|uniref:uncharacterized protein LOC124427236 n=1 Tax=Vespa crabro TaxID=7445 RepID=UPI001F00C7CA|nr:uncharacterized protein LOC124427236 [Vespa crabro]
MLNFDKEIVYLYSGVGSEKWKIICSTSLDIEIIKLIDELCEETSSSIYNDTSEHISCSYSSTNKSRDTLNTPITQSTFRYTNNRTDRNNDRISRASSGSKSPSDDRSLIEEPNEIIYPDNNSSSKNSGDPWSAYSRPRSLMCLICLVKLQVVRSYHMFTTTNCRHMIKLISGDAGRDNLTFF